MKNKEGKSSDLKFILQLHFALSVLMSQIVFYHPVNKRARND